jgi:hypothetical protein
MCLRLAACGSCRTEPLAAHAHSSLERLVQRGCLKNPISPARVYHEHTFMGSITASSYRFGDPTVSATAHELQSAI